MRASTIEPFPLPAASIRAVNPSPMDLLILVPLLMARVVSARFPASTASNRSGSAVFVMTLLERQTSFHYAPPVSQIHHGGNTGCAPFAGGLPKCWFPHLLTRSHTEGSYQLTRPSGRGGVGILVSTGLGALL